MPETTIKHTYQLKRGEEFTLQRLNPLLRKGEPIVVYCKDGSTNIKIGDGKNRYKDLQFLSGEGSGYIEITEPCHIATLDVGFYMVRGVNSGNNGKVILKNVTIDNTVNDDLFTITDGVLIITSNVKNILSQDAIGDVEECLVTFTAHGFINNCINIYNPVTLTSISVNNLRICKSPISENDFIEGNWYTYDDVIYDDKTLADRVSIAESKITALEEVASSGGITNLTPVDGSLVIKDNTIDVGISAELGNALIKKTDGLYVGTSTSGNYTAGLGLTLADGTFSVKLADNTHGLVAVDGALTLNLATKNSDGAMSKEDKLIVDSIPYTYVARKYDISNTPTGTLVDYSDHEIRIMCPANTQWVEQYVGETSNTNMYYMGLKAYAPNGAISFKEGDNGVIVDEMFTFDSDVAGTDEFGRNYSICWLALASYDESSDTWTYFGKDSTINKYVGWDYVVEWYDANGLVIASDSIRINLSNENCHNNIQPYYMTKYATSKKVEALETIVTEMSKSYCWEEI